MKSPTSSRHVLKSLVELSPELLDAKAAAREEGKQQQTQALVQKAKQHTIQPSSLTASDTRGHRGWGINE
jgi:hypothetical protein